MSTCERGVGKRDAAVDGPDTAACIRAWKALGGRQSPVPVLFQRSETT